MWTVQLTAVAADELAGLAEDQRAHFMRIRQLIETRGLQRVHYPHVDHLEGELWEIRMKGASGIARALYVARRRSELSSFACSSRRQGRRRVARSNWPSSGPRRFNEQEADQRR